jgi:hypothetical protein
MIWSLRKLTKKKKTAYFLEKNGKSPAKCFLHQCKQERHPDFIALTNLLLNFIEGGKVTKNHYRQVRSGLFEMKTHHHRLYYFLEGEDIVLIDGNIKPEDNVQRQDIDSAEASKNAYLAEKKQNQQ